MDSFMIPPDTTIRPQLPTEQRNKVANGDIDRYFLRGDDGCEREVSPPTEDPGEWAQSNNWA
jgi:hypothetical protein